MLIEAYLTLPNYAGDLSQASLPEYQVIRHITMPSVTKDSAKRHSTKGVQYPSYLGGQSPGLTGIKQDREDQRAKDPDLRPFAQISAAPNINIREVSYWVTLHRVRSFLCQIRPLYENNETRVLQLPGTLGHSHGKYFRVEPTPCERCFRARHLNFFKEPHFF